LFLLDVSECPLVGAGFATRPYVQCSRTQRGDVIPMVPPKRGSDATRRYFHPGLDASQVLDERALRRSGPATVAVSLPSQRVVGIDLLRILAAVGIVWFHTEGAPHAQIGYAGLPVFLLIFFSLVIKQSCAQTVAQFLTRRWDRLLKPWLFWCVVYGLCRLTKAAYALDWGPLERMLSLETFLAGTCIHLWYLPYAFASGLLIYKINRRLVRVNDTLVVLAATVIGVLTLAGGAVTLHVCELAPPLPQWGFGMAAIPLGLAVGRSLAIPARRVQMLLLSCVSAITLGAAAILVALDLDSSAVPYGLGVMLVCLAYSWQVNDNGFIAAVAPLTFGIYLLHPLVIRGLGSLLPPDGHYAAFIALTTSISGAATWVLMQTPLRRFV
jgi:peptidoglycan/LPS O-acetylase OafA/YrhL